jgi:hypothetical protein
MRRISGNRMAFNPLAQPLFGPPYSPGAAAPSGATGG